MMDLMRTMSSFDLKGADRVGMLGTEVGVSGLEVGMFVGDEAGELALVISA